jgi:nitrite reductase/ring-hydroxylating ferredoxin subunit
MIPIRTAYDLPAPTSRDELTRVGRGTPMGELLRRYWHPVALGSDAVATPKALRVLGEELVLFRDGQGRAGLLHARCAHRGASLHYGRGEAQGLRCCYHGWLFDVQGHCLDRPCEPAGSTHAAIRQPWYPVEERYGLVFAYLGPQDRQPVLPQHALLEDLQPGERVEADDRSIGSGGPAIVPCNWLQHFENVMDPFHVPILHGSFSGPQFVPQMGLMPEVDFEYHELGVRSIQRRRLDGGQVHRRITETMAPTLRLVASPRVESYGPCSMIGWVLPIDDTHFRIYSAGRVTEPGSLSRLRATLNGKSWFELSEAEHQAFPGDYEAQVGQGAITAHSEEHLATSDRGVAMLRRFLGKQVALVQQGLDPAGVVCEAGPQRLGSQAGNFLDG